MFGVPAVGGIATFSRSMSAWVVPGEVLEARDDAAGDAGQQDRQQVGAVGLL